MVIHIRRVLECNEENLDFREDSLKLCSRLGVHPRVLQGLTSIRNENAYE